MNNISVILQTQTFVKTASSVESYTLIGRFGALFMRTSMHKATYMPELAGWYLVDHQFAGVVGYGSNGFSDGDGTATVLYGAYMVVVGTGVVHVCLNNGQQRCHAYSLSCRPNGCDLDL